MKFLRVHTDEGLRDAVLTEDGRVATLPGGPEAFDPARLRERGAAALEGVAFQDVRLAAPLSPGKIVCVGLNYADHAAEGGQEAPPEPILFMKAPDTVVGANDDVLIPRGSEKTDWEVELGVVIGRTASYLETDEEALEHVAGYVLVNDVSERHFQLERGGQWDKGKNAPTFCPIGPWILTADEVADPQAIKLGLDVNGDVLQESSTAEMIFGVAYLVRYISQFMTLYPGDVISTGTPAGVGAGQKPPRYLKEGDLLRVWADGLGEQHTRLTSA
ncbi:2-keto-4-pentenoate hydratase/2-oxohepta-3-ene-1,7-dioic acid hydratase in catechol pathway [Kribbella steppae]|uniref:2-keto-4-pentenoate hydratase/2-oxohepta-3-ene-1,7-dioic acid hydratase in catechol pathway n=1 Tax=Kribbella steppae TaxID=2512223 RepID=A0A4V6NN94_9ACTN|nr:fumarylacetoacetate hydrolase family protein [Kribbella steppae]TCO35920.1 2-keto-4-pentenoate hydratase/2-oxohepta-3-ene-1,7-dioic acid hydratase in catechol pathway [Kribbella steppae]